MSTFQLIVNYDIGKRLHPFHLRMNATDTKSRAMPLKSVWCLESETKSGLTESGAFDG